MYHQNWKIFLSVKNRLNLNEHKNGKFSITLPIIIRNVFVEYYFFQWDCEYLYFVLFIVEENIVIDFFFEKWGNSLGIRESKKKNYLENMYLRDFFVFWKSVWSYT